MKPRGGRRTGDVAAKLARLQILADAPEEEHAYACALLESEGHSAVLQAALAVLEAYPDPALRPLLLQAYARLDDGGVSDPGCDARAAILRLLRHMVRGEDRPLLERGASTYEFLPPGPSEVAGGLRAAALVALSEVDERLAGYHAVRLLVDPRTSPMSGQPAVTAVQVLAAQGAALPLYAYLLVEEPPNAEVCAECLRSLTGIPESALAGLVARYRTSEDEIVLLGLFDLLLAHEARRAYKDFILEFLRETRLYNIYRYLVSAIIAGRNADLIAGIETLAAHERDPRKAEILREALALR
jgi:hypothetical protein